MLAVYAGSKAFLRTWSDSLTAELTPKGVTVEHVNTYFVVRLIAFNVFDYVKRVRSSLQISAMSKIRRPSLFIPNPKAFVRSVLAKLAPGTVTPYWTHALVSAVMTLAPPKMLLSYVHALQKDIRRRALAKQARLAKQE
jgi:17beta-estradiol 17-dehydrogenase / very-long-chain 3-oxoacyl-CoA reductase